MAHDLNNLLTPIWTFLQLSNEGAAGDDLNEDLLPVALRNIKTMRAYIREALFFSENLRPDFQLGRLDVVISQAVDLVRAKTEKSVDILVSSPGEVLLEMDEILIQRLVANIVSNAMDASSAGSTIHIELLRLVKTETNRDWLRVRVVDSGEGIRPEDLNRVFTPYFTTKNRGDQERGFGLGLAICRKIVHLHGGNLNIASQLKKGTTVQIDLPNRQVKPPGESAGVRDYRKLT
jgi:signal transduction histidine kinase